MLFGAIKSTMAAWAATYVAIVIGGPYAEVLLARPRAQAAVEAVSGPTGYILPIRIVAHTVGLHLGRIVVEFT